MAYDKQTWQTGDVVTSAKLNHMEDGIASAGGEAGGALLVGLTVNEGTTTCDKTAGEIWTAFNSGRTVLFVLPNMVTYTVLTATPYYDFIVWDSDGASTYSAASADDYPSAELP